MPHFKKEKTMKYFILASMLFACWDKESDSAEAEEVSEESEQDEEESEEPEDTSESE